MTEPTRVQAVNRLIAAAVAFRYATYRDWTRQWPELRDAVDGYLAVRTDLDRARDDFLLAYPEAGHLAEAIAAMSVHGVTAVPPVQCICTIESRPGRFPRILDREPGCLVHGDPACKP